MLHKEILEQLIKAVDENRWPALTLDSTIPVCNYNGDNNTHCALGVFVTDFFFDEGDNGRELYRIPELESFLLEKFPETSSYFWTRLQNISDSIVLLGRKNGLSVVDMRYEFKKALLGEYSHDAK